MIVESIIICIVCMDKARSDPLHYGMEQLKYCTMAPIGVCYKVGYDLGIYLYIIG